jgi:hypothetical protein
VYRGSRLPRIATRPAPHSDARRALLAAAGVAFLCVAGLAAIRTQRRRQQSTAPERLALHAPAPRPRPHFTRTFSVSRFLRGNIHTHTTLSDGNSTPERTILWYASHGYRFLALTDHNLLSDPSHYATLHDPEFVLLPGEEITMLGGGRQVHVNGLCMHNRVPGGAFPTQSAALSYAVERVLLQGGVPVVNHPNFDWALAPSDVLDARDAPLLEIMSGHPYVHTAGNATHPSHEALWDMALSAGAEYMGVAVDDVHRIDASGNPLALPGRAWIQVFGAVPEARLICAALARGELYASSGLELRRIAVTPSEYGVEPEREDTTVVFIGREGRVLARIRPSRTDGKAAYSPRGDEGYVRARLEAPDGTRAWTPAVRVVAE